MYLKLELHYSALKLYGEEDTGCEGVEIETRQVGVEALLIEVAQSAAKREGGCRKSWRLIYMYSNVANIFNWMKKVSIC